MKKNKRIGLDFVVDNLTNSIENVVTGDCFPTDITLISSADLKSTTKKNGCNLIGKRNLNNLSEMFTNSQS